MYRDALCARYPKSCTCLLPEGGGLGSDRLEGSARLFGLRGSRGKAFQLLLQRFNLTLQLDDLLLGPADNYNMEISYSMVRSSPQSIKVGPVTATVGFT